MLKGQNMEDRYLFKAKRIDDGEWVVGYIARYGYTGREKYYIIPSYASDLYSFLIDSSTICRCTGYAGIYEKDIFQCDDEMYVIEWSDYSLSWEAQAIGNTDNISLGEFEPDEIYAIGNTIDNPELLEV